MTNFIDGLSFSLNTKTELEDIELAEKAVKSLLEGPKFLRPKRFGYLHPIDQKVDKKNIKPIIDLWMGTKNENHKESSYKEGLLLLEFCHEGDFMVNWTKGEKAPFIVPKFHSISGGIPTKYVTKNVSRVTEYLDFVKKLVDLVNPVYGIIQNMMTPQWDIAFDLNIRLPDIPWGSILGEPYIELWGRNKILKAPFHHIEELPSGHIFAQLTESILEPELPSDMRKKIRSYFGEECFMEGKKSYKHYKNGNTPKFD